MKNLSSKSSHSKSHKPHSMTPKNSDETDIVSIGGEEFPEQTLQSNIKIRHCDVQWKYIDNISAVSLKYKVYVKA
jgi:hypothetical protein